MDTEKTNELITKVYAEIQNGFKRVEERLSSVEGEMQGVKSETKGMKDELQGVKADVQGVKAEIMSVKETVSRIEVEHGQKLSALFDGNNQNAQKLDRIEMEVKKHDEFILKRIK